MDTEQPDAPIVDHSALMKALATPYEDVYKISSDGRTYVTPLALRGTPVARVLEKSSYWESTWTSLDDYIAGETEANERKAHYKYLKDQFPDNQHYASMYKNYSDKVSWQRKIRDIFGSGRYNPNQLVSKHHLPTHGLCGDEGLLYHLACKVSDLQVLEQNGELGMDAWDWLRWRVARQVDAKVRAKGASGRDVIKSIAHRVGTDGKDADTIFRAAVIRSANYQGRKNSYGPRKKAQQPYRLGGRDLTAPKQTSKLAAIMKGRPQTFLGKVERRRIVEQQRAEEVNQALERKQKRRESQPTVYQGVNAFRQQKQASELSGPCGS
jgi:hypothetical protein